MAERLDVEDTLGRYLARGESDIRGELEAMGLLYHGLPHAREVKWGATLIALVMREVNPGLMTSRDVRVEGFRAFGHDRVMMEDSRTDTPEPYERILRTYRYGENERQSADRTITYMALANQRSGQTLFTQEDMDVTREAYTATIPSHDFSLGTVEQPYLELATSLKAFPTPLADINLCGMAEPDYFLKMSDRLFLEFNIDIYEAIRSGQPLPAEIKEFYKERVLEWTGDGQPKFVQGRKKRLPEDLGLLSEELREPVRALFPNFDGALICLGRAYERRKEMTFEGIVDEMQITP